MASFFDLSIPYLEHDGSKLTAVQKRVLWDTRVRMVVRAAELGYAGVAYNRHLRGAPAEPDRCRIPPLPLESLFARAPSLAASAALHRRLVGADSENLTFRQYNRVTIIVESRVAAVALNSASAILRSYDIVAARPTSRDALEIDLITIDFSQKLHFSLNSHWVQDAIKRGVYFEVTYSHLIDADVRKQMLSNIRTLVDWTRGKSLILSSSANTANDIRGPYDLANLSAVLLGLPMERAKAAISRNCRSLIVRALRRKYCYKEAIRIERIIPEEQLDRRGIWFSDCNDWDPLSSGDGDLTLSEVLFTASPVKPGFPSVECETRFQDKTAFCSQTDKGISFWVSDNLKAAMDTGKAPAADEVCKEYINEKEGSGSRPLLACHEAQGKGEDAGKLDSPIIMTKVPKSCYEYNDAYDMFGSSPSGSEDKIAISEETSDDSLRLLKMTAKEVEFESSIENKQLLHATDVNSDPKHLMIDDNCGSDTFIKNQKSSHATRADSNKSRTSYLTSRLPHWESGQPTSNDSAECFTPSEESDINLENNFEKENEDEVGDLISTGDTSVHTQKLNTSDSTYSIAVDKARTGKRKRLEGSPCHLSMKHMVKGSFYRNKASQMIRSRKRT